MKLKIGVRLKKYQKISGYFFNMKATDTNIAKFYGVSRMRLHNYKKWR